MLENRKILQQLLVAVGQLVVAVDRSNAPAHVFDETALHFIVRKRTATARSLMGEWPRDLRKARQTYREGRLYAVTPRP